MPDDVRKIGAEIAAAMGPQAREASKLGSQIAFSPGLAKAMREASQNLGGTVAQIGGTKGIGRVIRDLSANLSGSGALRAQLDQQQHETSVALGEMFRADAERQAAPMATRRAVERLADSNETLVRVVQAQGRWLFWMFWLTGALVVLTLVLVGRSF
jgi:hypothetical protein